MDQVESRGAGGPGNTVSPDKNRMTTYRKAAEEAIQQYRSGSKGAGLFSTGGGAGAQGNNSQAQTASNPQRRTDGAPPPLGAYNGPTPVGGRTGGPGLGPS